MLSDITRWLSEDEAKRRVELRMIAERLGLPSGRRWSDIPDGEVERIYHAVFSADYRTDAEFDAGLPF